MAADPSRLSPQQLARYRTAVVLRDGTALQLRPITPADQEKLLGLVSRLSRHTAYLRFHHVMTQLSREEAARLCAVDYDDTFALVATTGEAQQERIIAVGRYARLERRDAAEVAFLVEDPYQGKGIGTHLLEQLTVIGREKGILTFEAEVLAENQDMLNVFKDSGYRVAEELQQGVYRVVLPIAPTTAADEKSYERQKTATIASLRAFLRPRSVAVIGASRRPNTVGHMVFRNLVLQGFAGVVYPVNRQAEVVASVRAYPTVLDIPGAVDLAVVVVPAESVLGVVQECGRKGVRGLVVISAGFGESGPEGAQREAAVVQAARDYGMRLIGPNCMGIINTDAGVNMNATFSPVFPPSGRVAMGTQSGALGLAILEYARSLNIGLSTFVSIGNRADVSSNDLLQFWEEDPATSVILLYLESFGNPRKFARIARSVTASKPVVAVKSGRTPAGSRAAASHTGALATTEVADEALFTQAGLLRIDTLEELFDVASLLSNQPIPAGRRVAILTNGGGPGILTADACASRGLDVPPLSGATVAALRPLLSARASLTNPVDMTAEATAEHYRLCLKVLLEDAGTDIVIVIFVPPIVVQAEAVAAAIREMAPAYRERGKTLVASFMSARGASLALGSADGCCVPSFIFPESTAIALAKACEYHDWLGRPRGVIPTLAGTDKKAAEQVIEAARRDTATRPLWLDPDAVTRLLEAYGIKTLTLRPAATAEEAAKAARDIGFPVAVKLLSRTITHKTDVGGVMLDLRSPGDVEAAVGHIRDNLARLGRDKEMQGVTVQAMVPEGVEVIVGVTQDPSFGPLLMFGMGGIYTELFRDVTFRIHPLTDIDAREMVRAVKAHRILEGWRGAPPADIAAIEDLLLRVSAMIEDLPQIAELDFNPVKVMEAGRGYVVVDARVMLA